ncbi:MAG: hypothetical protein ACMUEL_00375 [Flavobacteriales bacterium Tduv]
MQTKVSNFQLTYLTFIVEESKPIQKKSYRSLNRIAILFNIISE